MTKRCIMTLAAALTLTMANAQTVTPQACEQSIVTPKATGRYLWLPIQESAPEGKVQVILNGMLQMEQNVRMAREQVDYYVALDLQPYQNLNALRVCVQNVPTGSVCFKKLAQNKLISQNTAENLSHAVGFRNIAVHQYEDLDCKIIYAIITSHLDDFKSFAEEIGKIM